MTVMSLSCRSVSPGSFEQAARPHPVEPVPSVAPAPSIQGPASGATALGLPREVLPEPAGPPPARPDPLPKSPEGLAPAPLCPDTPRVSAAHGACADGDSFLVVLARVLREVELAAARKTDARRQALEARRQELLVLRRGPRNSGVDPQQRWRQALLAARRADDQAAERLVIARDQRLARLESCEGAPVGFVRQLRAELRPECRESQLAEWVRRSPPGLDGEGAMAVRGLVIAARLDRLAFAMPPLAGNFDEPTFRRFLDDTVGPWQRRELARLRTWDQAILALAPDSYGKSLALGARMVAAKRLFTAHRAAKIPASFRKDFRVRTRYYTGIDEASRSVVLDFEQYRRAVLSLLERRGVIWHESLQATLDPLAAGQRGPVHSLLALPRLLPPPDDAPAEAWPARRLPSDTVERIYDPSTWQRSRTSRRWLLAGYPARFAHTSASILRIPSSGICSCTPGSGWACSTSPPGSSRGLDSTLEAPHPIPIPSSWRR